VTDDGADAVGPAAKRAPLPDWWWRQTVRSRRVIAVAVLIALVVVGFALFNLLGSEGDEQYAEAYAYVESLPPETVATWDALAECETNSDWSKNTGNSFFGGLQFQMSSWLEVGGQGQPDGTPREEQIYRADKLRQLQGWQAWPNCAAQLGLQ
jgi:hypothetical protein